MVVDSFVSKKHGRFTEEKADYKLASLRIQGEHIAFVKPQTFMNLSGRAVKTLMGQHELQPGETLVVCDDFALPFGKPRLRSGGSDGGHNGLSSIIELIGTDEFPRLRLGIGPVPEGVPAEVFVLEEFSKEEVDKLQEFVKLGISCLESVFYLGLTEAMNKHNGL